jgi:hypothetical protein
LLAILIQTKPNSTHGRKINTVSPEINLDERQRERERKIKEGDNSKLTTDNLTDQIW